ncbi:MAG: ferrous iron transport protein B [Candidatus Fimimonas sp.]
MRPFLKFLKKQKIQAATGATGKNSQTPTFKIALCGNPNSGKTTLFNLLTGSNQKVGNWPGVTVEQKIGTLKNSDVQIVDTPGVYSLFPFTPDEQVTRNFLLRGNPDLIINVVDVTALERSLFLTSQLAELNVPLVVALNMQDEARAKGIFATKNKLESFFGCKFFEISAAKNLGVAEMTEYCVSQKHFPESKRFAYTADVEKALQRQKAFEEGRAVATTSELTSNVLSAKIAQQRYEQISEIVAQCTSKLPAAKDKSQRITQKIDSVVLNKWLAFPIFAVVMALVFYLSVGGLGGWLTSLINNEFTPWLQKVASNLLEKCAPWLRSLVCDGIICGVMSVLGFLPQITLLFGFIAVLEASGYMSRIAFITDKLLRKIGLGGRSFVSMILGCGCSVPAIMATRTIKNPAERNATVTLTPFMPCSAKLAIISYFTSSLLGGNALFAVSFYFVSILAVILGGLVLKTFRRNKRNAGDAFLMELPAYRLPKLSNVTKQMWERGKAFLVKAGTIIFTASVLLWVLQNFNFRLQAVSKNNSILASIGKFVAPVFAPLGFGDGGCGWQFSVASLTGIASKETVFETLQILLGENVQNSISPLGAYSFTVYNILTVPCIAAVSASFSEQGKKGGAFAVAFQMVCAYVVSLAIYQTGKFARSHPTAFATAICCIVLAVAIGIAVAYLAKRKGCRNCPCQNCAARKKCR